MKRLAAGGHCGCERVHHMFQLVAHMLNLVISLKSRR